MNCAPFMRGFSPPPTIANGMYKKPVEILEKEIRYEPLAPDVRAVIVQSWRNFGLLPAATIEEMVPEEAIRRY